MQKEEKTMTSSFSGSHCGNACGSFELINEYQEFRFGPPNNKNFRNSFVRAFEELGEATYYANIDPLEVIMTFIKGYYKEIEKVENKNMKLEDAKEVEKWSAKQLASTLEELTDSIVCLNRVINNLGSNSHTMLQVVFEEKLIHKFHKESSQKL